jgi:hypothetical protein
MSTALEYTYEHKLIPTARRIQMSHKMIKVLDDSKVGFHYVSPKKNVRVVKNVNDSWVIYLNNEEVEMYGVGYTALCVGYQISKDN